MGVIGYFIATMTHKISQYTGSYELPNKKFSDVKAFMMSKDYVWSPAGKVRKNTDTFNVWEYEYGTDAFVIKTKIVHYDEYIKSCVIFSEEEGAEYIQQYRMKNLMKKVPDSDVKPQEESAAPVNNGEDYNGMSNQELLEAFDKKTAEFGNNPTPETFKPVEEIRNVLGKRIDEVPLSARGSMSKCLSDIDMFLPSIKTQLGVRMPNGTTAAATSAPTYVPKIRASIAELASLMQ